ncbi:MAG: 2-hydroxychromene-2-carboxylate isomerase [Gammaproteobacteria bacterium]|nr:2-hydroxychromene-2-carboxylate isomerase [Gammaproteobacteria bacterium]
MQQVDWYFDFISPFSYLACHRLAALEEHAILQSHPVLFAGILAHWEHKGPAEIEPKRVFSYRLLQWLADRSAIPFRMPGAHPFNPLPYLRLSIALENRPGVVREIFDFLWQRGLDPGDQATFALLCEQLGVTDGAECIADPAVKQRLKENTEKAISRNVFGVPTFIADGELFWGHDAIDFLLDCLADPSLLQSAAMQRVSQLPIGVGRT